MGAEKPIGKTKHFNYFAQGSQQGKPLATRLGAIILDAKTHPSPGQSVKQCYFDPVVAFRVWKNTEFVDAVRCFHCKQLVVLENNPKAPEGIIRGWFKGRFYVSGDFDFAHAQLLDLAKEVFPDDRGIQALT